MSHEEPEPCDQDYRSDAEQVQKPSNIVMLRMLPPNATVNEVCLLFLYMNTVTISVNVCGILLQQKTKQTFAIEICVAVGVCLHYRLTLYIVNSF